MVIGELFSLAKIFADGKRDLNREFFEDFIQPAWQSFAKIHEQYEKSLQEYARLLDEGFSAKQLSERIGQDVLYSATLRLELSQLVKHNLQPDKSMQGKREQLLSAFANVLIEYFNSRRAFQTVWEIESEPTDDKTSAAVSGYGLAMHELRNPRAVIVGWLELIQLSSESMTLAQVEVFRQQARSAFEKMIHFLQGQYVAVADSYYALKAEMLKS